MKELTGKVQLFALAVAIAALPFSRLACSLALLLFLAVWVLEGSWREKLDRCRENQILVYIFSVWIAITLLGLMVASDGETELAMLKKKAFLFLIPLALATTINPLTGKRREILLRVLVLTCFAASITALVLAFTQRLDPPTYLPPDFNFRIGDTLWANISYVALGATIKLHPTYFSLYLAAGVIILYSWIVQARQRGYAIALVAIMLFFISILALLSSRIVIGAMLLIGIAVLFREIGRESGFRRAISLAALMLIFALTYFNPIARYRNFDDLMLSSFHIRPGEIYEHASDMRFALWWTATKSVPTVNPLLGTGVSDVVQTMESKAGQYRIANTLGTYDPHNQFLFELLSHGAVGLACLLLCLGWPLTSALLSKDYRAAAFCFLLVAVCFTESILEVQKGIAFFSIFVPLMLMPNMAALRLFNAQKLIAHVEK